MFAAYYFWGPKIIGKSYNELLAQIHFWVLFVGVNLYVTTLTFKLPFSVTIILFVCVPIAATIPYFESSWPLWTWLVLIRRGIKGKAGVYMFYNRVTGHYYIGSSVNLARRFARHIFEILSSKLPLYNAIRKYGIWNFDFVVLEYCEPLVNTCRSIEQHYIDLHKPVYNILPKVGSSSGFKHSEETKNHLSSIHSGDLHPQYGVVWSIARRLANSVSLKAHFASNVHHNLGKTGVNAPQ